MMGSVDGDYDGLAVSGRLNICVFRILQVPKHSPDQPSDPAAKLAFDRPLECGIPCIPDLSAFTLDDTSPNAGSAIVLRARAHTHTYVDGYLDNCALSQNQMNLLAHTFFEGIMKSMILGTEPDVK